MKDKISSITKLKNRVRQTGDSEPEQIVLRLVIGLMLICYFCFPWAEGETFSQSITSLGSLITLGYYGGAMAIAFSLMLSPRVSPIRRICGIILDMGSLSIVMFLVGSESIVLFVLYLWVILGNGFRYGLVYLYISLMVSLIGFSIAITWGEYWQIPHTKSVSISLLLLLVLIPAYTSFLLKKLHAAISSAKQANEAKTRFLANMSHELRTPLNGVIGLGDLLRETKLNYEQRDLANTMHESARTLLGLIEKVLDISKIEAGKIVITKSEMDLHALVNSVLAMQTPVGAAKDLSVSCTIDPEVPFLLESDQQHIRQVLINLIGNAIKFTDEGSINLHISLVDKNKRKAIIRFDVKDTGIGIDKQLLSKVFDDFTQVGMSTGGTGLGTTISKELVELMGGKIGVESELHKGSTFWFELPFKVIEDAPLDLSGSQLLVMSTEATTEVLKPILEHWSLEFSLVVSPQHSLTVLNHAIDQGNGYKMLIIDQTSLGDMSPIEYAGMLKAEKLLDNLSLVLINSDSQYLYTNELGQYYVSVLESLNDKRLLFNAIHVAKSIQGITDNVVSLAEHYANQTGSQVLNILVAEDNKVNQQVIEGILKRAGHSVQLVDDGEQALDVLAEKIEQIDLLIVDKNMPNRSGDEVVQALRFMDTKNKLPIIMFTADATPESRKESLALGVNEFLTKPIDSLALLEKIAALSTSIKTVNNQSALTAAPVSTEDNFMSAEIVEQSTTGTGESPLYDAAVFQQLMRLDSDTGFIKRLVKGFVADGEKHVAGIKNSVSHDYLQFRESLHALKGSATELGAHQLSEICLRGEGHKPYDIGTEKLVQLSKEIERIYKDTVAALDTAVSKAEQLVQD
ncbi:MAG: response regulator [Piscirickettsiaceae bacterium]|nr:response regulator [Piscirickettsiaceae bacterium]